MQVYQRSPPPLIKKELRVDVDFEAQVTFTVLETTGERAEADRLERRYAVEMYSCGVFKGVPAKRRNGFFMIQGMKKNKKSK